MVKGACFSKMKLTPVTKPRFVAVSNKALSLLGLNRAEVMSDPLGPEYRNIVCVLGEREWWGGF
jgi:hypothetical protein